MGKSLGKWNRATMMQEVYSSESTQGLNIMQATTSETLKKLPSNILRDSRYWSKYWFLILLNLNKSNIPFFALLQQKNFDLVKVLFSCQSWFYALINRGVQVFKKRMHLAKVSSHSSALFAFSNMGAHLVVSSLKVDHHKNVEVLFMRWKHVL